MTAVPDLGPCPYGMDDPAFLAVGWLGADSDYRRGPTSGEAFEKLEMLCRTAWQPLDMACGHPCELCQHDAPVLSHLLFVPGEGRIYVAPRGITHYIAAHWYRPPDVFIKAVLDCAPMGSVEYEKAILANGGQSLLRQPASA
jgi:hypothetical protein